MEQAVEVIFHSLRYFDFLLLSVFVGNGDDIIVICFFCNVGLGMNAL
ncbi:Uncharacterised protein [Segatella copri]|nr:Uncharacterised protein [Segatella copri]